MVAAGRDKHPAGEELAELDAQFAGHCHGVFVVVLPAVLDALELGEAGAELN